MPAINKPNQHFDATTYPGSGGTQSVTNAGSFQPDLVWIKNRAAEYSHLLYNSISGAGTAGTNKAMQPDTTNSEGGTNAGSTYGYLSAFNSNGFTVVQGSDSTSYTNATGQNYVGWNWKAGGTPVTNTAGSTTTQVSANPTAGFSVVSFPGNASYPQTIGHGLGATPQFIIIKNRDRSVNWAVYHHNLGNTQGIWLNNDSAVISDIGFWNNTSPTSTVFTTGNGNGYTTNGIAENYIAYCWAPVPGYSQFGYYTGTGAGETNGPFVYCGFRPAFILLKVATSGYNWYMFDSKRPGYNNVSNRLFADVENAEVTSGDPQLDILSNGFKLRAGNSNYAGTAIYAAFAEAPFKFSNGR